MSSKALPLILLGGAAAAAVLLFRSKPASASGGGTPAPDNFIHDEGDQPFSNGLVVAYGADVHEDDVAYFADRMAADAKNSSWVFHLQPFASDGVVIEARVEGQQEMFLIDDPLADFDDTYEHALGLVNAGISPGNA